MLVNWRPSLVECSCLRSVRRCPVLLQAGFQPYAWLYHLPFEHSCCPYRIGKSLIHLSEFELGDAETGVVAYCRRRGACTNAWLMLVHDHRTTPTVTALSCPRVPAASPSEIQKQASASAPSAGSLRLRGWHDTDGLWSFYPAFAACLRSVHHGS
ncbi:hypothetical protein L227DRAFT_430820 [Lentinus tigrinus ALCF2SS1-6]|uniref:Uncharacterized protein n=1 Tax=Lentinus tigrinus ALCF2SS1-6 TaxID=1328759 RepID=A0A5C2SG31_9APHY|nr:hypothetical protein L227DRAFT_430820 [Lentinus tigrinus ALCF2SS1-6]